jgi:hypothetical protein
MKIYDYTNYNLCFLGKNIDNKLEEFIDSLYCGLSSKEPMPIHPKEIERIERLKKRGASCDVGHVQPIFSDRMFKKPCKSEFKNGVMIATGGCGFGTKDIEYFNKLLNDVNDILVKNDFHLLFVRGTNDDPSYFDEEKISFSNVKCLTSNCLVKFDEFSCLCIGGGISFDREWKKRKSQEYGTTLYWENEGVNFDINDISEAIKKENIACVVSNEMPTFISPSTSAYKSYRWYKNDEQLLTDTINDRAKIDSIYAEFVKADKKPYVWWYSFSDKISKTINDISFKSSKTAQLLNDIVYGEFNKTLSKKDRLNKPYGKITLSDTEHIRNSITTTDTGGILAYDYEAVNQRIVRNEPIEPLIEEVRREFEY